MLIILLELTCTCSLVREQVIVRLSDLVLCSTLDLLPENLSVGLVVCEEVVNDHLLGRLAHPLEQREVTELVRLEDFEHFNWLVTDVLDKMAHVARDDTNIARDIVESAGGTLRGEDGDTATSLEEERPLVGVRVPVHLANGAGLDRDVGSGYGLGDGKVLGVGNADLSAAGLLGLLVEHAVRELVLRLLDILASGLLIVDGSCHPALENVLLALGDVGKDLGCQVEVLGDDGLWRVCYSEC